MRALNFRALFSAWKGVFMLSWPCFCPAHGFSMAQHGFRSWLPETEGTTYGFRRLSETMLKVCACRKKSVCLNPLNLTWNISIRNIPIGEICLSACQKCWRIIHDPKTKPNVESIELTSRFCQSITNLTLMNLRESPLSWNTERKFTPNSYNSQ